MSQKETIEIQKELFRKGGKFKKYRELVLGLIRNGSKIDVHCNAVKNFA